MNIGFVSTRFQGTDGVTLEAAKWASVLEEAGHCCFWFSGLSDYPKDRSMVVPEAFFGHPLSREVDKNLWNREEIPLQTKERLQEIRTQLYSSLESFGEQFQLDLVVAQNALTIPMQVPLGLALADWLRTREIPAIAHHHDFYWERERFTGAGVLPYLEEAFPPSLPHLQHVVINSQAAKALSSRKGLDATVIPNVMDFSGTEHKPSLAGSRIREVLGYSQSDRIFLQPTRVVPRKGIELAIELLARRQDENDKLLISHQAGDEGYEYLSFLRRKASASSVDLRCLDDFADSSVLNLPLWDLYQISDFVTYPSLYEGFGNALLEGIAFRKPMLVNRYSVFREDIEPLGFQFALMDEAITSEVLSQVRQLLSDEELRHRCTEKNYALAQEHFGFPLLREKLLKLVSQSVSPDPGASSVPS